MLRALKLSVFAVLLVGLIGGCDDKDATKNTTRGAKDAKAAAAKSAAKPAALAEAEAKAKAAKPTVDPAAKAQCEKIVDRAWTMAEANLGRLGVENPASHADRYKKNASRFIANCAELPADKRECMQKAADPIASLDTCKVNENIDKKKRLWAPSIRSFVKLLAPEPIAPEESAKRVKALAGTWKRDWKQAKIETTWKISATGEVSESETKFGKKEDRKFKISFPKTRRLKVDHGSSGQEYSFVQAGNKTFYTSSNLVYDAWPVTDEKSFTVKSSSDYVLFKDGACDVISEYGSTVKGKCEWGKDGKNKTFTVEYGFPGKTGFGGKPRVNKTIYYFIAGHLLHESLVHSGKFTK